MPVKSWYFRDRGFPGLPYNGIIGLNTGFDLPAGWNNYDTYAGQRLILGSNTSNVLAGSTLVKSQSSDVGNSAHGAGTTDKVFTRTLGAGTGTASPPITRGSHIHTTDFYFLPKTAGLQLIQATVDGSPVPEGGIILGDTVNLSDGDTGLTTLNDQSAYLSHELTTGVVDAVASATVTPADDSHRHHDQADGTATSGGWAPLVNVPGDSPLGGGVHGHSCDTPVYSASVKAAILKAFVRVGTSLLIADRTIIMFDGISIPSGWALCDGTSGTPDLRTYGILLSSDGGLLGTYTGDNTISGSVNLLNGGSHNHPAYPLSEGWWQYYGHNEYRSHYHAAAFGSTAFTPYSRSLVFIQYIG